MELAEAEEREVQSAIALEDAKAEFNAGRRNRRQALIAKFHRVVQQELRALIEATDPWPSSGKPSRRSSRRARRNSGRPKSHGPSPWQEFKRLVLAAQP